MMTLSPSAFCEFIADMIPSGRAVGALGQPGIGKTMMFEQVSGHLGLAYCKADLSIYDSVDLKGIPTIVDGRTVFCPLDLFPTKGPAFILLDDFTNAAQSVQTAALQILLERRIGSVKLADDVFVGMAGNRRGDKAGSNNLISSAVSRMCLVGLDVSVDDWLGWAAVSGIRPEIRAYIERNRSDLNTFNPERQRPNEPYACPRAWHGLSDGMNSNVRNVAAATSGFCGQDQMAKFMAFLRVFGEIPDPKECIANPTTAPLPVRPDVLSALSASLVDVIREATDAPSVEGFLTYIDRMPRDFRALSAIDAYRVNRNLFKASPKGMDWLVSNNGLLTAAKGVL